MEFQVGDEVLLSTRTLPVKVAVGGTRKLGPLYCGPFRILEKYTSAYHLELPQHMQIHPVFHVSQLKLYRKPTNEAQTYQKPDAIMTNASQEEYEVEEIINHRKRHRGRTTKIEYLILWKGYPGHEMTWECEENVANAQEKIEEYYKRVEGNAFPKEGRL